MGNTFKTGNYVNGIFQDTSNNIGIGAAPSGTYKFEVTGTAKVSGILTLGSTLSNGTYTYTLPAATGTLALVGGAGVGTVTSVAALTLGTTGTDLSSTVATSTTTPVITLNVPTASAANRGALSSADWSTFNNKQSALTNPVTGTGTTNTLPKFTGTSTIGNSNITDTGSLITLGSNTTISSGALGIGTTSLTGYSLRVNKQITGNLDGYGIANTCQANSDVTSTVRSFFSDISTQATSYTLSAVYHYWANQVSIGAGSSVTTQIGFFASSGMTTATNNRGFMGSIPAASNNFNLYMSGTAANYMAGNLGIGVTSNNASAKVQIDSTTQGFLPPRMTLAQRTAIASPATGLIVYQTDGVEGIYIYTSSGWKSLTMV